MSNKITPHEPQEELLSSVEEAFEDAALSEDRWRDFERRHKRITIRLSEEEYELLENLARQQDKTVAQLAEALLDGVLSPLIPSSELAASAKKASS